MFPFGLSLVKSSDTALDILPISAKLTTGIRINLPTSRLLKSLIAGTRRAFRLEMLFAMRWPTTEASIQILDMTEFNSPSNDELRITRLSVNELKKQRAKQRQGTTAPNGLKPGDKVCEICFEKILVVSTKPSGHCIDCEKKLKDGMTAIRSMDGRHVFIASDKDIEAEKDLFVTITDALPSIWLDDFTIRGQVLPTTSAKMDALVKMYDAKKAMEN